MLKYTYSIIICFHCQHYDHAKKNMTCGSITCARCAEVGHDTKSCEKTELCANSKGDYTAYSCSCPNKISEKEFRVVKINQNVSYLQILKLDYS